MGRGTFLLEALGDSVLCPFLLLEGAQIPWLMTPFSLFKASNMEPTSPHAALSLVLPLVISLILSLLPPSSTFKDMVITMGTFR